MTDLGNIRTYKRQVYEAVQTRYQALLLEHTRWSRKEWKVYACYTFLKFLLKRHGQVDASASLIEEFMGECRRRGLPVEGENVVLIGNHPFTMLYWKKTRQIHALSPMGGFWLHNVLVRMDPGTMLDCMEEMVRNMKSLKEIAHKAIKDAPMKMAIQLCQLKNGK